MMHFGQCLRAILHAKKLSQRDAAALLEMDQSTISYYCNAKNPPRAHVLSHMAVKLGVSEGELLGERSGALSCEVAETPAAFVAADPWPGWGRLLRAAYRRDAARVELAVRTAWPKEAEEIIAWLRQKKR
jgi:transcriptional regulator with XRE-family HTH domain